MAYSFSKFKDWGLCPLRFKLKHLDKREEPSTSIAKIGKIVADLMAEIRLARYEEQRDTDPEERRGIAHNAAGNHEASEEEAEAALAIVEGAYAGMEGLLPDRARVSFYLIEKGIAFDRELKRIEDLPEAAYYGEPWAVAFFKCKPDFVWVDESNVLHVEDDKSGWAEADPKQLLAYAWCVREAMRQKGLEEPVATILHFNYLAMKKRVEVNPSEIDAFPKWLAAKVAEIEGATEYPANLGKGCDYCGFVAECPLHEKTRGQLATLDPEKFRGITTAEQAVAGGLWLMAALRCVDAAKAQLRAYVEANGPVALPGADVVMELRGGEPVKHATAGDVVEQILEAGIPLHEFYQRVKLSPTDVDGILAGTFPLGGKGVDKNVKAHNLAQRMAVYEALEPSWKKAPRAKTFGLYKSKEVA